MAALPKRDEDPTGDVDFYVLWTRASRMAHALLSEDRGDAEDVAQEAITVIWARLARGEIENVEAYLYTVVRRKVLDRLRRRRRQELTDEAAFEGRAATSRPDSEVVATEYLNRLVRNLPAQQARVIELHYVLGFTVSQVAEALGISESTAKTHLKRGLNSLRCGWYRDELVREDENASPEDAAMARCYAKALLEMARSDLTTAQFDVLVSLYYDGGTISEAARLLAAKTDRSFECVRTQIRRAVEKMRVDEQTGEGVVTCEKAQPAATLRAAAGPGECLVDAVPLPAREGAGG